MPHSTDSTTTSTLELNTLLRDITGAGLGLIYDELLKILRQANLINKDENLTDLLNVVCVAVEEGGIDLIPLIAKAKKLPKIFSSYAPDAKHEIDTLIAQYPALGMFPEITSIDPESPAMIAAIQTLTEMIQNKESFESTLTFLLAKMFSYAQQGLSLEAPDLTNFVADTDNIFRRISRKAIEIFNTHGGLTLPAGMDLNQAKQYQEEFTALITTMGENPAATLELINPLLPKELQSESLQAAIKFLMEVSGNLNMDREADYFRTNLTLSPELKEIATKVKEIAKLPGKIIASTTTSTASKDANKPNSTMLYKLSAVTLSAVLIGGLGYAAWTFAPQAALLLGLAAPAMPALIACAAFGSAVGVLLSKFAVVPFLNKYLNAAPAALSASPEASSTSSISTEATNAPAVPAQRFSVGVNMSTPPEIQVQPASSARLSLR